MNIAWFNDVCCEEKDNQRVRYESCNICRFFMNEWCMDYLFQKVVETQTSATLFCFEVAVAITNSHSNRIRTNQVCWLLGSQCYACSSIIDLTGQEAFSLDMSLMETCLQQRKTSGRPSSLFCSHNQLDDGWRTKSWWAMTKPISFLI